MSTDTEAARSHSAGDGNGVKNSPLGELRDAARGYVKARGVNAAKDLGQKLSGVAESLDKTAEGGGLKPDATKQAIKGIVSGDSAAKTALSSAAAGAKEKISSLGGSTKRSGSGAPSMTSIIEDVLVGVPVDVAYNQWTQYQEFPSFMKGVESVDKTNEVESNWRVKVFRSRRNWKATVTEQVPDRRIAWTSDGAKGTTKGVVTFHPLADDLTQILLVLEYYPTGLVERTGNLWRAGGRRARLDLKHFRRFAMERGEATGAWRGEIRDGEVVRGEEDQGHEGQQQEGQQQEGQQQEGHQQEGQQGEPAGDQADRAQGPQQTGQAGDEASEQSERSADREPAHSSYGSA
jgi:uncharacterized membrane protein